MQNVVLIFATNRANSYTKKVGNIYTKILTDKNVNTILIDLYEISQTTNLLSNELYGERSEYFQKIISEKLIPNSKLIFVVPEYNGSYPGILKVFLDAIHPSTWTNKKALLVGVSSGRAGNLRGMEHLTGVLNYLKLFIHHNKLPISQIEQQLDSLNSFKNESQHKVCEEQITQFLNW
ncbi:MAG: NAD(P)H-dependent oxidoreductase [Bacteroidetes bacterium]|nr:NAD(P)H-dependent oxidoreductase [Bacteroidota bacterium]